jgi:uncharacterized protein (DUF736 family)
MIKGGQVMEGAIKLTGLWKQKDKSGQTYLSGSLSPISKVIVMPNTYKKSEKDPDYFFYLGSAKEKREGYTPQPLNDL